MHAGRKIRVAVLFGGRSGEHEVSLRSARSVMDAIDKDKYEVVPVGITRQGRWLAGGDPMLTLSSGELTSTPALIVGEPGSPVIRAMEVSGYDDNPGMSLRDLTPIDVVFPILHGPFGEDGTVQGLLELADIPYVGAGVVGSAVGMDKAIFKSVMRAHAIPVLPYEVVLRKEWNDHPADVLLRVEEVLTYPVFVKPANLGSSVGVSRADNKEQLIAALDEAAAYDRRLVVEKGIAAREIEVSVMGNDEPLVSVPGEIIPGDVFYSYTDKYLSDAAKLVIPAPLGEGKTQEIQEMALQAYRATDCAGLARCDFLLDKATDAVWLNEINTIPGFTSISMYPKLWEASGIPYPDLIHRLIQYALERHEDKRRNKTSYDPGT